MASGSSASAKSKEAVALIVAGSGDVSETEVFDLLEDAYPQDDYDEVGLVVPVDKDLYTDAVRFAVGWFKDDDNVLPVQTSGASLSRASAKLGMEAPQKVKQFTDIFNPAEFEDWDQVHFLVAVPDSDDPDYDLYAEMVEVALESGIIVKDLTAGLDDVELLDPESEPETTPEPEPEPENRTRSRKRKMPEPDVKVSEAVEKDTEKASEEPPVHAPMKPTAAFQEALNVFGEVVRYLEAEDEVNALANRDEVRPRPLTKRAREAWDSLAGEPTPTAEETPAGETPTRGRGRPRTNFEVKQILDEDEWIPRPKGRLSKGTMWRTIHAETGEVLEEGTA